MEGYWSPLLRQRLSRRRALAATGAASVAALVAACSGNGSSDSQTTASIFTSPSDTSKEAARGGTWVSGIASERTSIDPNLNSSEGALLFYVRSLYSSLLKTGIGMTPDSVAPVGDAAQSWELTPDGRQLTLKMRPNHTFDPRPPTNGRAMTSADVRFSWERFVAGNAVASDVVYAKNPAGPVESLTTPDASTVVIRLAFPYAPITELLSVHQYLFIAPTEADRGGFNPRVEARGAGPWLFDRWEPNVSFDLKRNPNWYEKDRPYLDAWSRKIIPEYAAGLAQFEAGAIWDYFEPRYEDILPIKARHPEMVLSQDPNLTYRTGIHLERIDFSQRADSIFADVRVRRAFSMLIDRDAFIDIFSYVAGFRAAGLDADASWNSHAGAGGAAWVDPRDPKEMGEGAKYFAFDPTEAKRLIAAAGLDNTPFDFYMNVVNTPRQMETIAGMVSEGLPLNIRVLDYNTEFQAMEKTWNEGHSGTFFQLAAAYNEEALLAKSYTPTGADRVSNRALAGISEAVIRARSELDTDRRNEMVRQIQRDLALQMPAVPFPGPPHLRPYTLSWPWLKNYRVFYRGTTSREDTYCWYDASARPF